MNEKVCRCGHAEVEHGDDINIVEGCTECDCPSFLENKDTPPNSWVEE